MFGETKPPWCAQIAAASGLARYRMNAAPAAERRIRTAASPPATTTGPARPATGNGATSTSTPGTALVSALITPAAKSPSKTMAAAGCRAKVSWTDSW